MGITLRDVVGTSDTHVKTQRVKTLTQLIIARNKRRTQHCRVTHIKSVCFLIYFSDRGYQLLPYTDVQGFFYIYGFPDSLLWMKISLFIYILN